ncbi:MAG: hypothetical protein A2941_03055 [Candidatus Yanofskybacteria bacterium RIFCSPLOWO2_01_FULL_49_17]|uniref:Uncharacterized protein n=1 Tax=Candidatus Yanofskybacteria bacterium RIFCSPLOWO2_01_FULL_49_17 TaxID=1802700 RepID=A0A1F8GSL4_9BACT|nr:MAG: hypothetical protein A2941_03055 [Candidatus Yanofskybacteria bacterium RIFCSPLOWO2_01_FULL_49_17]
MDFCRRIIFQEASRNSWGYGFKERAELRRYCLSLSRADAQKYTMGSCHIKFRTRGHKLLESNSKLCYPVMIDGQRQ